MGKKKYRTSFCICTYRTVGNELLNILTVQALLLPFSWTLSLKHPFLRRRNKAYAMNLFVSLVQDKSGLLCTIFFICTIIPNSLRNFFLQKEENNWNQYFQPLIKAVSQIIHLSLQIWCKYFCFIYFYISPIRN